MSAFVDTTEAARLVQRRTGASRVTVQSRVLEEFADVQIVLYREGFYRVLRLQVLPHQELAEVVGHVLDFLEEQDSL